MKYLGLFFVFSFLLATAAMVNGYVLSVLWEWFIVSAFNVPKINIPSAIGLAMVVAFLTQEWKKEEEGKSLYDVYVEAAVRILLKPLTALIIGWVVTLFL